MGFEVNFWWHLGTKKPTGMVPMNPFLSSLSFSPFPKAVGKFLLILNSTLFVSSSQSNWLSSPFPICLESLVSRWELLVVWATIPHLIGNPQPSVLFPDSTLGTAGSLVCCSAFVRILPQIPHWEPLVAAAIPHLSEISLQLPFEVCLFNPFFQSQVPHWELLVVHREPFSWPSCSNLLLLEC